MRVISDIAHEFASALAERLGEELVQVGLFGSRARGEARWRSDYDLMVVLRNASGEARDAVHRLATTLELEHNVDLSTKIVDRERFERLRRTSLPFWRNYARDERVLWPPTSSQNAGHPGGRSSSGVNRTPAETSYGEQGADPGSL